MWLSKRVGFGRNRKECEHFSRTNLMEMKTTLLASDCPTSERERERERDPQSMFGLSIAYIPFSPYVSFFIVKALFCYTFRAPNAVVSSPLPLHFSRNPPLHFRRQK
jgi:hypothetical protein